MKKTEKPATAKTKPPATPKKEAPAKAKSTAPAKAKSTAPAKAKSAAPAKAKLAASAKTGSPAGAGADSPSRLIDARIAELGDWRGATLAKVRALIKEAIPGVEEEWKWRGVPTWYKDGMICTGETYKAAVKVTFAKGAHLSDPAGLFNSSLEGNVRRAMDIHEGAKINGPAFKALLQAAAALNSPKGRK